MQGTTFGPYTIEELLGRGGMGEVYRAFDTETDREVALKVLPPHLASDAEYLERFRRECRAAAKLREPHIVPIHRFGEIDGRLYLDMRLVEGPDLGSWLHDHGPLSPAAAVAVISQVASALDAAHAAGMVHRDVKPSNILLAGVPGDEVDPGSVFAYLSDFGIAGSVSDAAEDGSTPTRTGTVPGSLAHRAPERFRGITADRRVDVYALACVLYQSLTGRQPFDGDLATVVHAHLTVEPPPASGTRPDVPAALDQVIARGMAKNPDDRYPTAGAFAAAARAVVGTQGAPGAAAPDGSGEPRTSTFGTGAPMPRTDPETDRGTGPPPAGPGRAPVPPAGPPPGKKGKRSRTIAVVAAALVVLGAGGAAAYALSGSGGGGESPSTTTTRPPVVSQTVASVPPATGGPGPSTGR